MPKVYASFNPTTNVAKVGLSASTASGFTAIGSFNHPDETYPDSYVIYHGVRELLYHRSAADITQTAMYPDNITDMHKVSIDTEIGKVDLPIPVVPTRDNEVVTVTDKDEEE